MSRDRYMICDPYKQTSLKPLYIDEQMIYGSSRTGVLDRSSLNLTGDDIIRLSKDGTVSVEKEAGRNILSDKSTPPGIVPVTDKVVYSQSTHTLGLKHYELTNHLGNVLTTVSDLKLTTAPGHFTADITSAQDYYPFGSLMPGRKYSSNSYRFGFQGQEKDDEITGVTGSHLAFKHRIYDARLGRFLSLDPLAKDYPWNSPYAFAENRVIYGIELEGLEYIHYKVNSYNEYGQTCIELTGEVDYDNWLLNTIHKVTGAQPEIFPVHVVEAPDGLSYLFATKEEAYTSEMDDYNPKTRYTLEGIGALYTLLAVFGKVLGNTIKSQPKYGNSNFTNQNNSNQKTSTSSSTPSKIDHEVIEVAGDAAEIVEDAAENIKVNDENSNETKTDNDDKDF